MTHANWVACDRPDMIYDKLVIIHDQDVTGDKVYQYDNVLYKIAYRNWSGNGNSWRWFKFDMDV